MRRLEAWLVAAALVFAGCIGAAAQGSPAMEHRGTADDEARERFPDADLVEVNGIETNESADEDRRGQYQPNYTVRDERIGDGGAPAWVYTYVTRNVTYDVVVNEDGEVVHTEREGERDALATPIGDWEVSSTEAVEIVQEHNGSWQVRDDGAAFYSMERENETSDPIWEMGQLNEGGIAIARVNATTGEYLGSDTFDGFGGSWTGWSGWGGWGSGWENEDHGDGSEAPPQEGGSFSGSVSAAEDTSEHAFTIEADQHRSLGVRLQAESPGTGSLEATIEGPDGELGTLSAGSAGSSTDQDAWGYPEEGDYTITVELTDGVERGYRIDWCAEGHPTGGEASEACDRVYDEDAEERASLALVPS